MHAQRQRYPRPVSRYRDVQGNNVLVTRDATGKVLRLQWPAVARSPDAEGAPGTDGTPQSISPAVFRVSMALLVVATAMVWVNLVMVGPA